MCCVYTLSKTTSSQKPCMVRNVQLHWGVVDKEQARACQVSSVSSINVHPCRTSISSKAESGRSTKNKATIKNRPFANSSRKRPNFSTPRRRKKYQSSCSYYRALSISCKIYNCIRCRASCWKQTSSRDDDSRAYVSAAQTDISPH